MESEMLTEMEDEYESNNRDGWRLDQIVRIISERDQALKHRAWYRAAFGLTVGVLLVVVFT